MRQVRNYSLADLDSDLVEKYFRSYSSAKDEKYEEFIEEAREIVYEKAKLVVVYDSFAAEEFDARGFKSDLLRRALIDDERIYVTVSSVINEKEIFDEVEDDPIIDFFAQSWMVAMLNGAREKLREDIVANEVADGFKLSSAWSPGQADIPIENQGIIFDILQPEDLGITITKHYKMKPQMSVSGIMGVRDEKLEEKYNSCDFCDRKELCPGYNGITLKGQEFNRRLT